MRGKIASALKHHAMKAYRGVDVQLHAFLTPVIDATDKSASRSGQFTPRKRALGTHRIEAGWAPVPVWTR
jgi:hypothetical protein